MWEQFLTGFHLIGVQILLNCEICIELSMFTQIMPKLVNLRKIP